MIKAVFFDLDGTLVNSLKDLANSTNFALNSMGFESHKEEEYKYFVGDGMIMLIKRALPQASDEQTVKECHKRFLEHYSKNFCDKTSVYDGINDTLRALKKSGYKIAVVSNKMHTMALEVVKSLFDDNIFDIVTGKQTDYPTKPNPALTLKIARELGVEPCDCVFVGDSGMDMKTAVNCGMLPIGVLWGFRTEDELLKNGAIHIIENPQRLLKILESANG